MQPPTVPLEKFTLKSLRSGALSALALLACLLSLNAAAQTPTTPSGAPPSPEANCTVMAMNRTAPLQADYSFTIHNLPDAATIAGPGIRQPSLPFRVRAICSDGTLGETNLTFREFEAGVVYTGDIFWRPVTPIPLALKVTADQARLGANQSTQIRTVGILANGATAELTARNKGTLYTSSNALLVSVDEAGLARVFAQFAPASAARVIMSAQNEGVAASEVLQLGPRGRIRGRVYQADGVTPVAGARVNVVRNQPRESMGIVSTNTSGEYVLEDVSAGMFSVSVVDPLTGDPGRGFGRLQRAGDTETVDIRLNGQGVLQLTVIDGAGVGVPNATVNFSSLSGYSQQRTMQTNAAGQLLLEGALAGEFTVAASDPVSQLSGAALGNLVAGARLLLTLKLQTVGSIGGTVFGTDGSVLPSGAQIRLSSASRGIIGQMASDADGHFHFAHLPLSDSPYTLDAVQDGRLRARVPNLMLYAAGQHLTQDIAFAAVGAVTGMVTQANGIAVKGATLRLQSQVGLRSVLTTTTDAQGRYVIDAVPVGAFALAAIGPLGEAGSVAGNVNADGELVPLDVQLAANGVVGTVFDQTGSTPVGAGVMVQLMPGPVQVQTNALGQFAFSITQPGTYSITAADGGGNRGQTSISLATITPGSAQTANVRFLGRGVVQGLVRDVNGLAQAAVPVRLQSSSPLATALITTTDSNGRYRIDGVFVGDFSVYARHAETRLAGVGGGRIAAHGEQIAADITLAATGSINGRVQAQGTLSAVPHAVVELKLKTNNGGRDMTTTADALGHFSFEAVPLDELLLSARNPANGDLGRVSSRLTLANEARTVNVIMQGQGMVKLRTLDRNLQPLAGVQVSGQSSSQFGGAVFSGVSDANGLALLGPIANGDFSIEAALVRAGERLTGSVSGTLVNGVGLELTVSMEARASGAVTGRVTRGVRANPLANAEVRLVNINRPVLRVTNADQEGRYAFDQLEAGQTYRLMALMNGRVLAFEDFTPGADSESIHDLALLGVGTVIGRVADAAGQPLPNLALTMVHPDPVFGGRWTALSNPDGSYRFDTIPAGNLVLQAASRDGRGHAMGRGALRFDADVLTLDLRLADSIIALPVSLYDANGTLFDVQDDGAIGRGTNGVFDGNGLGERRANRLEIVVNGVAVPFQNAAGGNGRLLYEGQMLEVDGLHEASGLFVRRQMYVPKAGYFARSLEVLENRTASPVTVGVQLVSSIATGVVGARLVDTSSDDSTLDVSAAGEPDRWLVVDDERDLDPFESGGNPAVAMVFDGTGVARVANASVRAIGTVARVAWAWHELTVQPGASIALLHFASQQLGRIAAREAAGRLVQLPTEALFGLSDQESAAVQNFRMPMQETSVLPALPPLPEMAGAIIAGTVLAGDGVTPVAEAPVVFKSAHPLFGRLHRGVADERGRYAFATVNTGQENVIAIPRDRFTVTARHPLSLVTTAPAITRFDADENTIVHDLIFAGTGILSGQVRRYSGALVAGGWVGFSYRFPGAAGTSLLQTPIDAAGTYLVTGIAPNDYRLVAGTPHPQGKDLRGIADRSVAVVAGSTATQDILIEATGEVRGTVRGANGEPVVGAQVWLDPSPPYRTSTSDTGGQFHFSDVPTGGHVVEVRGSDGLVASSVVEVVQNATASLALKLAGTGRLQVQVKYQTGGAAIGARVELVGQPAMETNALGQASFSAPANVRLSIVASHPDNVYVQTVAEATISANGVVEDLTLVLPSVGAIAGRVVREDGATPAAGVRVVLRRQDGAPFEFPTETDDAGHFQFRGLGTAAYTVTAENRATFKFAYAETAITTDGQEVLLNLPLADSRIALPANLHDANDFLFDIQRNGSIGAGWRAPASAGFAVYRAGGANLEINGQAFTGNVSAFLEAGRRQFSITQDAPLAGLLVSRKVFVPRGAYFARYLEVLENRGTAPVTVSVRLKSSYAWRSSVFASSSDAVSGSTGASPASSWLVLDDATDGDPFLLGSPPATAMVLAGADRPLPPARFGLAQDGVSLEAQWPVMTVPAGGRRILMHFQVQQIDRAGAIAAAQRLQSLPPEALASLSPEELVAIANFTMPADGGTTMPALPNLAGAVSGLVLEGDQRTVVPATMVEVRSTHPLFGRRWMSSAGEPCDSALTQSSLRSNAQGIYSLQGRIQDRGSVPLPVGVDLEVRVAASDCFPTYIGHPLTRLPSATTFARFAGAQTTVKQDVVFASGILTGTVTGSVGAGVASGRLSIVLPANGVNNAVRNVSVPINNEGGYVFPGLPAGKYDVQLEVPYHQGGSLLGRPTQVTVSVGQTTVADIPVEATGVLDGTVVSANGEPIANRQIAITRKGSQRVVTRKTMTDALGRYQFSGLPTGDYLVSIVDSRTGVVNRRDITVQENQTSLGGLIMDGTGLLDLNVAFALGAPAANTPVYLRAKAVSTVFQLIGYTDGQGKLTAPLPIGDFTIGLGDPEFSASGNVLIESSGTLFVNLETMRISMRLPARAALHLTVLDYAAGNVPVAGARVKLFNRTCVSGCDVGFTDQAGKLLLRDLFEGNYSLDLRMPGRRVLRASGYITAELDGQTVARSLLLDPPEDHVGVLSFGEERQLFSVPVNQNDRVSVAVSGTSLQGGPISLRTRAQVYAPNHQLLAQGYHVWTVNSDLQGNSFGDLLHILAPASGNLAMAISSLFDDSPASLGAYRLQVLVNDIVVPVLPYADGATVEGKVTVSNGAPAADVPIEITAPGSLAMRMRTATDADGRYRFAGVPLGDYAVRGLAADGTTLAQSTGRLEVVGQTRLGSFGILPRSTLKVQIVLAGDLPVPEAVQFNLVDASGLRAPESLYFAEGQKESSVGTVEVYGDKVTIHAAHPDLARFRVLATITGADRQTQFVTLTLASSFVKGRISQANGEPAGNVGLTITDLSGNAYLGSTTTDAQGNYYFGQLPAGVAVLLRARDPLTQVGTSLRATLEAGQGIVRNLQMPVTGTLSGLVRTPWGEPVAYANMTARFADPDAPDGKGSRDSTTDANGRYLLTGLPIGSSITVSADVFSYFTTIADTTVFTLDNGNKDRAADFLLDTGGAMQIQVRDLEDAPVFGYCIEMNLTPEVGSAMRTVGQGCNDGLRFVHIPAGKVTVSGLLSYGQLLLPATLEIVSGQELEATARVSLIKGRILAADGTVPRSLSMILRNESQSLQAEINDLGQYRIQGAAAGGFSLDIHDHESGLSSTASGALVDPYHPLILDLTLKPAENGVDNE